MLQVLTFQQLELILKLRQFNKMDWQLNLWSGILRGRRNLGKLQSWIEDILVIFELFWYSLFLCSNSLLAVNLFTYTSLFLIILFWRQMGA